MDKEDHVEIYNNVTKWTESGLYDMILLLEWNELLLPIMILQSPKMQTMIVSLAQLRGQYGTFTTLISAGVFIGIVPISIIYLIAQNQIIKGMTVGTVKG